MYRGGLRGSRRRPDYISHGAMRRGRRLPRAARTTSPIRPRADAGTAASEAPARCPLGAVVRGVCGVTPRGRQRATVTEAAPGGGRGVYGAGGARSTAASEA